MNDNPLVSICIPTFNRAGMLEKTVQSALDQTYHTIEVIVVDNASTDNTAEVLKKFTDPRFRFVTNSENVGIFGNCNRCITLASGEFIHILHSDDYIDPRFTETCVHFFKSHPEVALTFTSARFLSEAGECGQFSLPEDHIFRAPEGFRQILTQKISLICPSVMVRKEVYSETGSFSLEYPYASDYYQWMRISQKYAIGFVKDAWINYRVGDHSETYTYLFRNPLGYVDVIKIYIRILIDLGKGRSDYNDELNYEFYQYIKNALSAGFLRSDQMTGVDVSFFPGVATSVLSLIKTRSFAEKLKKCAYYVLIQISGILMSCSIFRKGARYFLTSRNKGGY